SHTSVGRIVATGGNNFAVFADDTVPSPPGTHTIKVTISDVGGATVSSTDLLTVGAAGTAVAVPSVATVFNASSTQVVTLTAQLPRAQGGTVNEGTVTFPLGGLPPVTATVNGSGAATASLTLPAGLPGGTYTIIASYIDSLGNFPGNTGTGALTVAAASTQ